MSNDKPAPTDAQILAACEEAGLVAQHSLLRVANGAFARYHAAINRMLAAEAPRKAGPEGDWLTIDLATGSETDESGRHARIKHGRQKHTGRLLARSTYIPAATMKMLGPV